MHKRQEALSTIRIRDMHIPKHFFSKFHLQGWMALFSIMIKSAPCRRQNDPRLSCLPTLICTLLKVVVERWNNSMLTEPLIYRHKLILSLVPTGAILNLPLYPSSERPPFPHHSHQPKKKLQLPSSAPQLQGTFLFYLFASSKFSPVSVTVLH